MASVYSNYLAVREQGAEAVPSIHPAVEAERVNVSIYFTTDLAELEALGFEPTWQEDENRVTGSIDLANLEGFAEHDGVKRIGFGEKGRPTLKDSIPDIRADQVWSRSGNTFGGVTGSGVLIGLIDTGIDFHHLFFLSSTAAAPTTRIKRIWDQGLVPTGGEQSPDLLLIRGTTYGVEYTDADINAVLRGTPGAMAVRHRDSNGHGTHMASIAAGNGQPDYSDIGVAPQAELIVVKLGGQPTAGGSAVGPDDQVKDAVTYILNVTPEIDRSPADPPVSDRPVVINYSIGSELGPHDGRTELENWLERTFSRGSGRAFVQASGNWAGRRQHARIEFPAGSSTVQIPVQLRDDRRLRSMRSSGGQWQPNTPPMYFEVWYPNGGATLAARVDFPRLRTQRTPRFVAWPPLGGTTVPGTHKNRAYGLDHAVLRDFAADGGEVVRNWLSLRIEPHQRRHLAGEYMLELTSSDSLTAHLWCLQPWTDLEFLIGAWPPGTPQPANVHVEDDSLIGEQAGAANTITVACYDAVNPDDTITWYSGRGPLVSHGPGPPQPRKPDLAAPGHRIDAAESGDIVLHQLWGPTIAKNGSSQAAAHVSGAIALMFERNRHLTVTEVGDLLRAHVRAGSDPPNKVYGAGRLDVRNVIDHVPSP